MTSNQLATSTVLRPNYQTLIGNEAWARLHPDIQSRFSLKNTYRSVVYKGVMQTIYLSLAGKLLAQLCRLIGTPLALYCGTEIPVEVNVYPDNKLNGITWDRNYFYPDKPTNRIRSTKCILKSNQLIEVIGSGFGMYLDLYEKHSAIVFESTEYFLQVFGVKLPIPHLLTPGKTRVSQRALESGEFEFSLDVNHPLLGLVFKQSGRFREVKA